VDTPAESAKSKLAAATASMILICRYPCMASPARLLKFPNQVPE
jgi:hypothetical protein